MRSNVGLPGWPHETPKRALSERLERALGRFVEVPFHTLIMIPDTLARLFSEIEQRFGPFDSTRLKRNKVTGALAIQCDSTRGLIDLVRALAAVYAEGGPSMGEAMSLGGVLLLPLGLEFTPRGVDPEADERSEADLPRGTLPGYDQLVRQLTTFEIDLPYSYVFSAEDEIDRNALQEALARFPVAGVREELEVPSPFDQAVAAARSEAGLEFFPSDPLTPVVRVWAATTRALYGLLDTLTRYSAWARRSPEALDQMRAKGAEWLLEGILEDLGFTWR